MSQTATWTLFEFIIIALFSLDWNLRRGYGNTVVVEHTTRTNGGNDGSRCPGHGCR
ncbi:MAG: hypothetical protein HYX87_02115 [Chloroflexi bacterium]|nr:hypothetical protein [Chloroflexota bacterium]